MPLVCNIPEYANGADALHADPVPVQDVASEKPWHRLAILLAAQGCTVTEIAERLERSVAWVSLLLRQPWARERLMEEINTQGRDEIEVILRGAGPEAVRRVIYLSEEAENEAVRLAANREILDRLLGKSVQKTETEVKGKVALEMSVIDQELRKLEEQERLLLGGTTAADGRRPDASANSVARGPVPKVPPRDVRDGDGSVKGESVEDEKATA